MFHGASNTVVAVLANFLMLSSVSTSLGAFRFSSFAKSNWQGPVSKVVGFCDSIFEEIQCLASSTGSVAHPPAEASEISVATNPGIANPRLSRRTTRKQCAASAVVLLPCMPAKCVPRGATNSRQ